MHSTKALYLAFSWLAVALIDEHDPLRKPHVLTDGIPRPPIGIGNEYVSDEFPATYPDETDWYNNWCKGYNLIAAMHASDSDAGKLFQPRSNSVESKWKNFGDLATWHWMPETDPDMIKANFLNDDDDDDDWPGYGLGPALNDLGLSTHQSDDPEKGIRVVYVSHSDRNDDALDQTYKVDEKTYRSTYGFYKFGIETATGAIFGLDRLAPQAAVKILGPAVPKEEMPQLQRFSDVAWLYWAREAAVKHKLKYFINVAIINPDTQRSIRRALKNTKQPFGPWPGAVFDPIDYFGTVLLGTPNGRAWGYFLAQHKAELGGNMYISQIRVFAGETEPLLPNMVFHVAQARSVENRQVERSETWEQAKL